MLCYSEGVTSPHTHTTDGRPRARGLGISLAGRPGPLNAITDVPGVEVGTVTLIEGDAVRTGVTAILPRGRAGVGRPCAAGWHSLNGNGEMTGTTWIKESGAFNLPIAAIEHARRRRLPHRGDELGQPGPSAARAAMAAAGVRGDVGRLPQRHQRRARAARTRGRGDRRGPAGAASPRARSAAAPA